MAVARCRLTTNRSMRRNSFVWSDASMIEEPQLTAVRKRRMRARRASAARRRVADEVAHPRGRDVVRPAHHRRQQLQVGAPQRAPPATVRWLR